MFAAVILPLSTDRNFFFLFFQWLVKRAIETREEMGDYIRSYSISQFQKTHRLPEVRSSQFFFLLQYVKCSGVVPASQLWNQHNIPELHLLSFCYLVLEESMYKWKKIKTLLWQRVHRYCFNFCLIVALVFLQYLVLLCQPVLPGSLLLEWM